jgi:hypothetical protein
VFKCLKWLRRSAVGQPPSWLVVLISLGLHGFILLIPLPTEPDPAENPEPEQVGLIELPPTAPPAIVPPSSEAALSPDEDTLLDEPPFTPDMTPKPEALSQSSPTPSIVEPTPMTPDPALPFPEVEPQSSPTPEPLEEAIAVPKSLVREGLQAFFAQLQTHPDRFGERWSLQDILEFFGEPEQAEQLLDPNQQPLPQIEAYHLFPEQTPQQVLEIVLAGLSEQQAFEVQPIAELGGGMIYGIYHNQDALRYVHIMPLNPESGSLLVMLSELPDGWQNERETE